MNAKVKRMWVKALLSGRYKQGKGTLRRDGRFCCLGVLCDLHAKATGGKWKKEITDDYSYHGSSATLPQVVAEWSGINDDDPRLSRTGFRAAKLNDSGKDFNYIADRIENYL